MLPVLFVGIDLSLCSPAFTFLDPSLKQLHFCFYPQRLRDWTKNRLVVNSSWHGGVKLTFICLSKNLVKTDHLVRRYQTIVRELSEHISTYLTLNGPRTVKIYLEGYAFAMNQPGTHKLHELGGCLKSELFDRGWEWDDVPPSRVKKLFSGKGNATKEEMHSAFVAQGFPNLLDLFTVKVGKDGNVPVPAQDIVDATALVAVLTWPKDEVKKTKTKTTKRKRRSCGVSLVEEHGKKKFKVKAK